MRQRKIKDIEKKIEDYRDLMVPNPEEMRGKWRSLFCHGEDKNLYVEIGCGKGKFISELAESNPEDSFVAIEGFSSIILRAFQKIRICGIENVRFVLAFVNDLGIWFADEELDGIYLNFSDPWPKKKNAKRRLTYRDRLAQYALAVTAGGFIQIKTDNDDFFDFTLEEIREYNEKRDAIDGEGKLEPLEITRDLHNSQWKHASPMTEYEGKFVDTGKNINYIKLKVL